MDGNYAAVRFDRSGRYVMASGVGANVGSLRSTQLYDTESATSAGPPLIPDGAVRAADFSVDGRHVATACTSEDGHSLELWDWRSGERAGTSVSLPSEPLGCEYDPTGTRLAVRCLGGEVLVIDPSTGSVTVRFNAAELSRDVQWIVQHGGVRWSGDGRSLVTWGGAAAQVWDPATTTQRYGPLEHGSVCSDTAFSPGGEFLASAAWDGSVRVWEFATGRPASAPLVHGVASHSVWFLPDGRHLLTGCMDNTIRLWDWRAGRMVQPVTDEGYSYSTQASPDGRWLLCGTTERSVRLWDVSRRQPLTPAIPVGGDPWTAEFSPNGRLVAVSGSGASIELVRLDELHSPVPPAPQRALACAELVAGQRLDRGTPVRLTGDEWLRRWREIGGPASKESAADVAAWHRTQVVAARAAGDAAAELFHLKKLAGSGAADWGDASRAAYLYGVRREWRDAAESAASAVRLRPTDARLHVFHGDTLIAAGDTAGAEAAYREALKLRPAQQGWVRGNWWTAGPFPGGIAAAGPDEASDETKWRLLDHDRPALVFHDQFHWAEHVTGYARMLVYCDRAERTVTLVLGSDDGVVLWLNGQEAFRHDGYITPGERKVEVRLKKGFNKLLAAVANERRHHSLYMRIQD